MITIEKIYTGKDFCISCDGVFYVLETDATEDQFFDSFEELVEANSICEKARREVFGDVAE